MRKNKSYTYVLPMLPFSNAFISKNLVNCFVGSAEASEYTNHIFLLFEFSGEKWFVDFERLLSEDPLYVGTIDIDYKHTMYIFKVPEEHQDNYNNFKKGHYSAFSDTYKKKILKFHNIADDSNIAKVLYKAEDHFQSIEKYYNIKIPRELDAGSAPYMDIPEGWTLEDLDTYKVNIEVFQTWMRKNKPNEIKPNTEYIE